MLNLTDLVLMKVSFRLIIFLCPSDSLAYLEVSEMVKQQTKQLELNEDVHELEKKYVYNLGENASKSIAFEI